MANTPQVDNYKALGNSYNDEWYDTQVKESFVSAKIYIDFLWQYIEPNSVLDVGCGRGAWLARWKEKGSTILLGYDGPWNNQANMIDSAIKFSKIDLNRQFGTASRVDLCMTLEVAEHLEHSSAEAFIKNLTGTSDMVLFGAAYTGQGGTHHINERPHTYWAKYFETFGYVPFDMFRPVFWADERICFWYRQNTFLFVKNDSGAFHNLLLKGLKPMSNIGFMDCIHPALYASKVNARVGSTAHLVKFIRGAIRAIRRHL